MFGSAALNAITFSWYQNMQSICGNIVNKWRIQCECALCTPQKLVFVCIFFLFFMYIIWAPCLLANADEWSLKIAYRSRLPACIPIDHELHCDHYTTTMIITLTAEKKNNEFVIRCTFLIFNCDFFCLPIFRSCSWFFSRQKELKNRLSHIINCWTLFCFLCRRVKRRFVSSAVAHRQRVQPERPNYWAHAVAVVYRYIRHAPVNWRIWHQTLFHYRFL